MSSKLPEADIIHIRNEPNLLPFLSSKGKYILHLHNDHLNTSWFGRLLYKQYLKKVCKVLCVSDYIKESTIKSYPEFRHKIKTVYNGVNTSSFYKRSVESSKNFRRKYNIDSNKKIIVFAGRMSPNKGVDILIQAIKTTDMKDCCLVLVGSSDWYGESGNTNDSGYLDVIRQEAEGLDVRFTGYIENSYLPIIYSASDICVVPSRWKEPFGLVCVEAMACECAVIVSDQGGLAEIVDDGVNGLLFKSGNSYDLANKLKLITNDSMARGRLGKAAREHVCARFSWDIVASNLIKEFEEVI